MSLDPRLCAALEPLARRRQRFQLWWKLAGCWGIAALTSLVLLTLQRATGWWSPLCLLASLLLPVVLVSLLFFRSRRGKPDWRGLALTLETAHPELQGRLLTAVQQPCGAEVSRAYLQQRLLDETLAHRRDHEWRVLPESHLLGAASANLCTIALFLAVLANFQVPRGHGLFVPAEDLAVSISPGDATIERGSTLVVSAHFKGRLPSAVELVVSTEGGTNEHLPLLKSLDDPLFGTTVPEVGRDLTYHVEYSGKRSRDYLVKVFDYPRLERADADIQYPEYTKLKSKHLENTRRLSGVEGSRVGLKLQLNKPIAQAWLIAKGTNHVAVRLSVETNRPAAELLDFPLAASRTYELQLIDADGRTNKLPAQFAFEALPNRTPEVKVSSPRGDTRPSSLEELVFEGTVFDDFGVQAFGIGSSVAGQEPKLIELGRDVPGKEKRPFRFTLRLEELGLQTDDLMSWFVWAEDVGPDGKNRRTTGDLYFAEIRPFDEIFREGASMSAGAEQQQSGQGGGQAAKLVELQKQIINATWKLLRQSGQPVKTRPAPALHPEDPPESSPKSSGMGTHGGRHYASLAGQHPGIFGQRVPGDSSSAPSRGRRSTGRPGAAQKQPELADDLNVVQEALAQALEQAESIRDNQADPKNSALWETVTKQMEQALDKLRRATNSPSAFQQAVAAEQAAYQALLKLQEREYSVSRSRNSQRSQSGRQQQMQRQLDQLDLSQAENRYETERQARAPQEAERNEQLQVINRLQELARRQQDLNQRLQELQTALQEARSEKEREEIRRQLKRLQEDQQELVADADEVRQRMERPENQSRMSEQRQQMEQTRNDLQRAADATRQGEVSQALASGTRAQRQLQQMREDMRRQSAGEFDQELRQMRADARELARQQEELQKKMEALNDPASRTLSDADLQKQALEQLARQRERLTNLVENATELSRQAEEAEPLMSRELYDSVRKFSQDETSTSKQFQEEFINRRMTETEIYQRLKRTTEESNAKSLDITSEMLRRGLLSEAGVAEERARTGINDLKRGVERAAQNVIGDDSESLRRASEELNRLAEQVQREIASGEGTGTNGPQQLAQANRPGGSQRNQGDRTEAGQSQEGSREQQQGGRQPADESQAGQSQDRQQESSGNTGDDSPGRQGQQRPSARSQQQSGSQPQQGQAQGGGSRGENRQGGDLAPEQAQQNERAQDSQGRAADQRGQPGDAQSNPQQAGNNQRRGGARENRNNSGGGGGNPLALDWDRLLEGRGGNDTGPITGQEFGPWSDRLREVEELVDSPSMRSDVARARERARQMRQDFRRSQKKPDWATVRLQVLKPLVEVRNAIEEELARRDPGENLVPIDRDPVPGRYSELVRKYYEKLGKGPQPVDAGGAKP